MRFIETSLFTRLIYDYISDREYHALQIYLSVRPDAGDVVPGSGGVRKLRWAAKGKGKSGGVRVIYYWRKAQSEIWMLTVYAKNEVSSIPVHLLREIAKQIDHG
jgi:hypothetical protein